jgi:hypothetical protein
MKTEGGGVLKEGVLAGFVLFLTVAVFFALVNVFMGRWPFHTAQVLGEPMLGPAPDPLSPDRRWAAVAAFNGTHLLGSIVLGVAAAALAQAIERAKIAWYVFFFIFVAGSIVMILGLGILAAEVAHLLAWHSVATAHLAGAATTTAFLWWTHARRAPTSAGEGAVDEGF